MGKTIFVSGIDTDAGKTYATAWLGNQLRKEGFTVTTQKFIQTGNIGRSEDIEVHRRLMGDPIEGEDWSLSAPIILSYPASADLAARIDGVEIDLNIVDRAREANEAAADIVLLEGAGGLMVPIDDNTLAIDYIVSRRLPVALVTNARLGSINHTLLSLEALRNRSIPLEYLLYNEYFDSSDPVIATDTCDYIRRHTSTLFPSARFLTVPTLE